LNSIIRTTRHLSARPFPILSHIVFGLPFFAWPKVWPAISIYLRVYDS